MGAERARPLVRTNEGSRGRPGVSVRHRGEGLRVDRRDRAGVLERADALDALLAAEAGLLHAAERRAQVETGGAVVVDPHVAADQLRSDALRGVRVGRPHRAAEAAPRVVREAHRLLLGVERDDRDDGAELLLRDHAQARVRVDDDRGAEEVAAGEVAAGQLAELADVGAGILRLLDDLLDERLLRGRVQRPHRGALVEAVAELRLLEPRGEPGDELVEARAVHEDALGVHADLPGGVVDRRVQPVEVGVVEDRVLEEHRRVVAAQLERDAGERLGRDLHDPLAAVHASR